MEINQENNSKEYYGKRHAKADLESQRSDLNLDKSEDGISIWKNFKSKF